MAEPKCLFERLDDISAQQESILNEVIGIKNKSSSDGARIAELEIELEKLRKENTAQQKQQVRQQPQTTTQVRQPSSTEILQQFIKQSKKSWRWFGNKADFNKWKTLSVVSLVLLLLIGVVSTIVSSVCFQLYSTFTFFENAWLVIGIIFLTYACKAQQKYEVNALASHSPDKYEKDSLGMCFPKREKVVFKIFRIIAIVAIVCNIIAIWVMGHNLKGLATFFEILFLGAIIFSFFMNFNLYAQYAIIYVEGNNLTTKEKVTIVLPPGAKEFMLEEDFKKKSTALI